MENPTVNINVTSVSGESRFDGGLLQLVGWTLLGLLITVCTLGICLPWAYCMVYRWEAKHTVINGHRLAFDGEGVPMLYVFDTCKHFIRTVPALVYDETDVEDVDTDGEDHIYDELRYVCMKNPIAPRPNEGKKIAGYDPLDRWKDETRYDRYDFYRKYQN